MPDQNFIKSDLHIYWKSLGILLLTILLINLVFIKYLKIISFFNLFGLIIPNLLIAIVLNRYVINKIKGNLKDYMEKNYPEKLKSFYDNYTNDSNPGAKPIMALFMDKELLEDKNILFLKNESDLFFFLLVAVGALTIMVFLIATVFILRAQFTT
jgi:hypothetical protein